METTESPGRETPTLLSISVDDVVAIEVGPGCFRKDLPSPTGVRVWVVDMVPGSEWPYVDEHGETGEQSVVISGEVIEGDERFQAGTYLYFAPGSSHRPRTEIGARLFGFNIIATPDRERPQ